MWSRSQHPEKATENLGQRTKDSSRFVSAFVLTEKTYRLVPPGPLEAGPTETCRYVFLLECWGVGGLKNLVATRCSFQFVDVSIHTAEKK